MGDIDEPQAGKAKPGHRGGSGDKAGGAGAGPLPALMGLPGQKHCQHEQPGQDPASARKAEAEVVMRRAEGGEDGKEAFVVQPCRRGAGAGQPRPGPGQRHCQGEDQGRGGEGRQTVPHPAPVGPEEPGNQRQRGGAIGDRRHLGADQGMHQPGRDEGRHRRPGPCPHEQVKAGQGAGDRDIGGLEAVKAQVTGQAQRQAAVGYRHHRRDPGAQRARAKHPTRGRETDPTQCEIAQHPGEVDDQRQRQESGQPGQHPGVVKARPEAGGAVDIGIADGNARVVQARDDRELLDLVAIAELRPDQRQAGQQPQKQHDRARLGGRSGRDHGRHRVKSP